MATGVPLVTTRVGQAADLVQHGENGWIVEVDDVEGLVLWVVHVADARPHELQGVLRAGRETAEASSYEVLRPRWQALLRGFVAMPDDETATE
jgi:glycosyltransferase involved in cell wall biosynthesis